MWLESDVINTGAVEGNAYGAMREREIEMKSRRHDMKEIHVRLQLEREWRGRK